MRHNGISPGISSRSTAKGNVDRLVFAEQLDLVVNGNAGRALHDDPMLGSVVVTLQRKAAAGFHNDLLHLVALAQMKRFIASPGPVNRQVMIDLVSALGGKLLHDLFDGTAFPAFGDKRCVFVDTTMMSSTPAMATMPLSART